MSARSLRDYNLHTFDDRRWASIDRFAHQIEEDDAAKRAANEVQEGHAHDLWSLGFTAHHINPHDTCYTILLVYQ